ncbi:hypothetical protein ACFQS6_09940 [Xanthomonas populi]|nr:hypothetical protein [Xanthomonas populi]
METQFPGTVPQTSTLLAWGKVMLLCAPIGLVPVSLFIDFVPAAFLRFDLLLLADDGHESSA